MNATCSPTGTIVRAVFIALEEPWYWQTESGQRSDWTRRGEELANTRVRRSIWSKFRFSDALSAKFFAGFVQRMGRRKLVDRSDCDASIGLKTKATSMFA